MKLPADLLEECQECESWNVRLIETTSDVLDGKEIVIYHIKCRECGFEWSDYEETSADLANRPLA